MASSNKITGWDQAYGKIQDALWDSLEEVCLHAVADIHASLSVEVVRDDEGNVIERSKPGEPPRLEFGQLQMHVDHEVFMDVNAPEAVVTAERPPADADDDPDAARILEYGGSGNWGPIAARPFMRPAATRIESEAPKIVRDHIARAFT